MENKTVKDYTVVELKAIAYDTLIQIEGLQNNIKVINQELMSRQEPPIVDKTPDKEEVDPQGL